MSVNRSFDTLQLVTTPRPFFEQEIRVLEQDGVSCTVLDVPGTKGSRTIADYLRFQARVLGRTVRDDFDLVHANYGLMGIAAVAQPRRPFVLSLWGSEFRTDYGPLIRASAALADAVIVMSDRMARSLDRDCYVIPHGIDTELFAPRPTDEAKAELGWDADAKHVLFPYDPERPIKSYPRASRIVDAVNEAMEGRVELQAVHGVAHERVPTYMNAADALLLTSESEGSPNAIREAMACNLPVVSVDVGDVADRVSAVRNCVVDESDEELAQALVDVFESGGRSDGREYIDEFSLDRMRQDILQVYDDVLERDVV